MQRWFIIDSVRNRQGQYTLILHRDLIADYYNIVIESPMFIEKASLPYNSPLLFNNEDMTFNQIKTNEYLLKDKSDCAWLVGYYSKDNVNDMNGTVPINTQDGAFQLDEDIENWEYYKYSNLSSSKSDFISTPSELSFTIDALGSLRFYINNKSGVVTYDYKGQTNASLQLRASSVEAGAKNIQNAVTASDLVTMNDLAYNYDTATIPLRKTEDLEDFLVYGGERSLIRDASGKVYQVSIIENNEAKSYILPVSAGSLFNVMSDIVTRSDTFNNSPNVNSFNIKFKASSYYMILTRVETYETKYNFGSVLNTSDAPWNIFAIPYGKVTVYDLIDRTWIETSKEIAITTANTILKNHPSIVYDVQLLPYCPVPHLLTTSVGVGEIYVDNNAQFSYITTGEGETLQNVGVIFNVPSSNFSINIFKEFPNATTAIEQKINNECDKWRLCSPNYSNYFDFSVEKNGGVQYFNIDCNYKPFTPYIHINPNFGNLYGYDDNSPRGLVLGGDFSLSQIIDQWQQYQVQNKNFQEIFDRQIQNMEINNKYQRINDVASAIAGVGTGAASGALAGSATAPGWGTAVGAIVGAGASLVGGIADINIKNKLRNEAIDYTKDQFGYQLGNIQALPNTIGKVSAFNENNKIFPVLEYYTCTEEEKKALLNKLAWNGMTTMVIGTINDYIGNDWSYNDITSQGYIKGQLIRFNTDEGGEDFHVVNEISSELYKGVYIK